MTSSTKKRIAQIRHGQVPKGYRLTRCGIVPGDWAKLCLGDIYTERNEPGNENLPLLMVSIHSGVSDGEVDEEQLPKKVKRIADKTRYKRAASGDLAFNMMRAWQGAIGTVRTEGMVSPAYIVAVPNDKVDPLFMDYYVKMDRTVQYIHRQSYGVTDFRLRLYWDSFVTIPCVLPPLAEQRKIAKILATQDRVIELLSRKIEQLKLLKKNCLRKLFPRHGSDIPEVRFRGFIGAWVQKRFGELYKKSAEKNDGSISIDRNITVATMQFKNDVHISTNEYLKSYYTFKIGDIAFEGHQSKEYRFGRFVANDIGDGIVSHIFSVFRPISRNDLRFWKYAINNEWMMCKVLSRSTKASTMMHELVEDDFLKEVCYVPGIEEQKGIGSFFTCLDNFIAINQRRCDEEERKKKALMQLLLTGIVRVNGKEAAGSRFSTRKGQ